MAAIDACEAIRALFAARAPGNSICLSEAARVLAAQADAATTTTGWRGLMPAVHAAVDRLLLEQMV